MRLNLGFVFLLIIVLFFCCASAFAYEKIEELYLRSDYPAVIEEGARILSGGSDAKNQDRVYYFMGLSNMKIGNFQEARNDFNLLLKDFPNSSLKQMANLGFADTYFLEENYAEANKFYEKLAEDKGSHILSNVYYKLAQTNIKLGNWQQAKGYLEKIKNEFPLSFEATMAKDINLSQEFFTVQVGSFINPEKAQKLSNDLKAAGLDSYILENNSQGKIFYRVRVGKLASLKEAKELEQSLQDKNYPTKIFP